MINRRNLCQVLTALALAGLSSLLHKLVAAGPIAIRTSAESGGRTQHDKQRPRICILRRQSHGTCETFFKQSNGALPDADSAEKTKRQRARV